MFQQKKHRIEAKNMKTSHHARVQATEALHDRFGVCACLPLAVLRWKCCKHVGQDAIVLAIVVGYTATPNLTRHDDDNFHTDPLQRVENERDRHLQKLDSVFDWNSFTLLCRGFPVVFAFFARLLKLLSQNLVNHRDGMSGASRRGG